MHHKCTTFKSVINFSSMETQRAHVTSIEHTFAVNLNTKGMSSIVDHLQSIFIGNLLDLLHLHRLAIAMHRHNCSSLGGNSSLNLIGINTASFLLNINKHRLATIPPNAMSCGHKAIWCSDYLSRNTQSLQCCQERKRTISKQTDVRHLQILCKCFLQLLMETTIISNPLTCPNFLQHFIKLIEVGQQR